MRRIRHPQHVGPLLHIKDMTMNSDDDNTIGNPDRDPKTQGLVADATKQPIPPRLKLLAEQLQKALAEASRRNSH